MRLSSLLIALLICTAANGQSSSEKINKKKFISFLDSLVPSRLQEWNTPGISIVVMEKGKTVLTRCYGTRDHQLPVTSRTVFNIGSVSKTFTAWGILKLAEEGKLSLDDPIGKYLRLWKFPASDFDSGGITIRMLLSHTAGVSMRSANFYLNPNIKSTIDELRGGKSGNAGVKVIAKPGQGWRYSGGGYLVLQLLIEELSGKNFETYMQENIFRPLGMESSSFKSHAFPDTARGYAINLKPVTEYFVAEAAASLNTSINDFSKFLGASYYDTKKPLLSKNSLRMLYGPAPHTDSIYGLGYFLEKKIKNTWVVGHDGANAGWRAIFRIIPATGDGIAILTNSAYGSSVYNQILCKWYEIKTGLTENDYCRKSSFDMLIGKLFSEGLSNAKESYLQMKIGNPGLSFSEGYMSFLGYDLYERGFAEDAILLLELNAFMNSKITNAFDSLAEIYLRTGNKQKALENYNRLLEIEPGNKKANEAIQKINSGN